MSREAPTNFQPQDHRVVGVGADSPRALVVNIQDPNNTHRYQCRIEGEHDDLIMIPDEKLPWCEVEGGSHSPGGTQTATDNPTLMPGAMVKLRRAGGKGAPDLSIVSVAKNHQPAGDPNQTTHPLTQGQDKVHSVDHGPKLNGGKETYMYSKPLKQIAMQKTTPEAQAQRVDSRNSRRTAEPIQESQEKVKSPPPYSEPKHHWIDPGAAGGSGTGSGTGAGSG